MKVDGLGLIGRALIAVGLTTAGIGALLWLLSRFTDLERFPGTLRIERPGFSCTVPILGSIILSILLTIVLNLILRFLGRRGP